MKTLYAITHNSYIRSVYFLKLAVNVQQDTFHLIKTTLRTNHSINFHFYVTISLSFQLDVTILYESLCPDSVAFFRDQLRPNYEYFKNFINVNLVPFGKSQVSFLLALREKL